MMGTNPMAKEFTPSTVGPEPSMGHPQQRTWWQAEISLPAVSCSLVFSLVLTAVSDLNFAPTDFYPPGLEDEVAAGGKPMPLSPNDLMDHAAYAANLLVGGSGEVDRLLAWLLQRDVAPAVEESEAGLPRTLLARTFAPSHSRPIFGQQWGFQALPSTWRCRA